jgi:small subunit ribosomal protein S3
MGQKVDPSLFRQNRNKLITAKSNWFAKSSMYKDYLLSDIKIRQVVDSMIPKSAGLSEIRIERTAGKIVVTILVSKPGVIIGNKGKDVEQLKNQLSKQFGAIHVNIKEVRKPDLDSKLVAKSIATQLEQRAMFRRVMKRAVSSAMRGGAQGIKICVSGRLGGAEIARSEWCKEGRVPLHTIRANIDYGTAEALTTYGIIGVKVWIFKGEVIGDKQDKSSGEAA